MTAEDVGMSVADMIEVARTTKFVAGLPNSPATSAAIQDRTRHSACFSGSRPR